VQRAYFEGCSTGGRQALTQAQRYPADFDGIIAGCPTLNPVAEALHVAWSVQQTFGSDGQRVLKVEQLPLVHEAMLAACDARDGARDGIIADPGSCAFNPMTARCKGRNTADCLSPAQAESVRGLYQGARTSRGDALYPGGAPPGSESFWVDAFIGPQGRPTFEERLAESFLLNLALDDRSAPLRLREINFDRDPQRFSQLAPLYAATDPDLRGFARRGGKLIAHVGGADPSTATAGTIDYYENVTRVMGGSEPALGFARLYVMPGVGHCGGGAGADVVDFLSALERWVERGEAPDLLVGYHLTPSAAQEEAAPPSGDAASAPVRFPVNAARVEFTRPYFPYPDTARYSGKGEVRDYRNWVKAAPRAARK
jgi:feruloyl esterase